MNRGLDARKNSTSGAGDQPPFTAHGAGLLFVLAGMALYSPGGEPAPVPQREDPGRKRRFVDGIGLRVGIVQGVSDVVPGGGLELQALDVDAAGLDLFEERHGERGALGFLALGLGIGRRVVVAGAMFR
jgi:hypothetical protein